jgi:hypothetical protein
MESANNCNNFIKSVVNYKIVSIGLSFQGKELNYPGYSRQKVVMDINQKKLGIFSSDYRIRGFNKNPIRFDTSNEILQVDGVIFSCNGYDILQDITVKKLKDDYVYFEIGALIFESFITQ